MPPEVFYKKAVRKNFAAGKSGWKACNFIKKRLQHRTFSCEYWEISKNTYFEEHLRTAAPEVTLGSEYLGPSFSESLSKPS